MKEGEDILLDRTFVARVQPALERRQERRLELVGARLGAWIDDDVDVDLEVARTDRHLHPVAVAARLRKRTRDRRLAHAEKAEHAAVGRLRPCE